jgi:methionyl-tRNA formyltransferase
MKISILTSKDQWFIPFAKKLQSKLDNCNCIFNHTEITIDTDICFILSYHKIIQKKHLKAKKNIIIHASDLPEGKGWSPMFWQILEGKNDIVFSMFEANEKTDDGDIYLKKILHLDGYELYEELREKQANFIIDMCLYFLDNYHIYKLPTPQKKTINKNIYPKRTPKDSNLDINKTIKEQFNLMRISSNEEFASFFEINNQKYILNIKKDHKTSKDT